MVLAVYSFAFEDVFFLSLREYSIRLANFYIIFFPLVARWPNGRRVCFFHTFVGKCDSVAKKQRIKNNCSIGIVH